ncbi:hypothetical protein [Lihuaxuella thermophila]|nr:hypothetical protein [Lihuaxuella thermophila]
MSFRHNFGMKGKIVRGGAGIGRSAFEAVPSGDRDEGWKRITRPTRQRD